MLKRKDYIYNWDEIPIIVDAYFVADLLKCSVDIIYKDCRKGKLKAFKVGDLWRIRKDNLIKYTQAITEFVNGETGTVKNASLAHILGLNRRELREIMPYDPDRNELELYKLLLRSRAGIEEWKQLRKFLNRNSVHLSAISSALEYQPVSRYMRYIEEQAEQYKQQDCGDIKLVIEDYADYIQEAKQATATVTTNRNCSLRSRRSRTNRNRR